MYELRHELANNLKPKTLRNFKKILEMSGIKDKCPAAHSKSKLWQLHHKIAKKTDLKHFTEKHTLSIFKNMSTIFCPRWRVFLLTFLKVQYFVPDIPIKM